MGRVQGVGDELLRDHRRIGGNRWTTSTSPTRSAARSRRPGIRDLERGHYLRTLDLEDAKERGDTKAVDVIAEDLGQREATITEAVATLDKVAPRPA